MKNEDVKIRNTKDEDFANAERILYSYKDIPLKLNVIEFKLNHLLNDDIDVSAIDYSKDRISKTNKFSSSVEDKVIIRDKKISDLEKQKEYLNYIKNLVERVLVLLQEDEKRLIELRYFSKPRKSWPSIARELNVSYEKNTKDRKRIIESIKQYLI